MLVKVLTPTCRKFVKMGVSGQLDFLSKWKDIAATAEILWQRKGYGLLQVRSRWKTENSDTAATAEILWQKKDCYRFRWKGNRKHACVTFYCLIN